MSNLLSSLSKTIHASLALAIIILIIAVFGQCLWNIFLAGAEKGSGYFTFIKPLPSPLHTIGVYLTLVLFFGSC